MNYDTSCPRNQPIPYPTIDKVSETPVPVSIAYAVIASLTVSFGIMLTPDDGSTPSFNITEIHFDYCLD